MLILLHTLVWAVAGIVAMVFNPTGRFYLWLAHNVWAQQVLRMGGAPLTVKGLENIDPSQSYVVCVNHQSLLDIPVLYAALPVPIRFLAKKSLFYIPVFGWCLWLAGYVPLDRTKGKKARASLKTAARRMSNGRSLTIFPEGTRSPDGKIHQFKSGAFIVAIEAQCPILPVVVDGTYELASRRTLSVAPHPVQVRVGKPIVTTGLTSRDRNMLMAKTREQMLAMRSFESNE